VIVEGSQGVFFFRFKPWDGWRFQGVTPEQLKALRATLNEISVTELETLRKGLQALMSEEWREANRLYGDGDGYYEERYLEESDDYQAAKGLLDKIGGATS
jgi:hypothetical protein